MQITAVFRFSGYEISPVLGKNVLLIEENREIKNDCVEQFLNLLVIGK